MLPSRFALGGAPVDAVGAGDMFLCGAVVAETVGEGGELGLYLGSALAGAHVGRLGNDPLPLISLQDFLHRRPELVR